MDVGYIVTVLPRVLPAFGVTLEVTVVSLLLAMLAGIPLGTARSLLRRSNPGAWAMDGWVGFVRGTPLIVQIFAAYFLLPKIGLALAPLWIGITALAFNSAGYQIEIARAAVGSVPSGQSEGAAALGLSRRQVLGLVILPQALRRMTPALLNEASQILKASSVLSVLAVFELHKAAGAIMANSFRFLDLLAVQAILYLSAVVFLEWCAAWLARRFAVAIQPNAAVAR